MAILDLQLEKFRCFTQEFEELIFQANKIYYVLDEDIS